LLLTAPLLVGRGSIHPDLLKPREYRQLVKHLAELERLPADLLSSESEAGELLDACDRVIDSARIERLLGRGLQLAQAGEHWQQRAIWVLAREDDEYPERLRARFGEGAPALLYGCGDAGLLDAGGLAVVGSRNVDDALIEYTTGTGRLVSESGRGLVSGGARGIDQAAMRGALEAGGPVIGMLADSLGRAALRHEHLELLRDGRLVLASPYDPKAGFNVGFAMARNRLIYALSDAALVVSAEVGKGGTWAGATEQLDRLQLVPVYVRTAGAPSAGLDALMEKGALAWPEPQDRAGLEAALLAERLDPERPDPERPDPEQTAPGRVDPEQRAPGHAARDGRVQERSLAQLQLGFPAAADSGDSRGSSDSIVREAGPAQSNAPDRGDAAGDPGDPGDPSEPAAALLEVVMDLMRRLARPESLSPAEVSVSLHVSKPQAGDWLGVLEQRGLVQDHGAPDSAPMAGAPLATGAGSSSVSDERAAELLFESVRRLILELARAPIAREDLATRLGTRKRQSDAWVRQLVGLGELELTGGRVRAVTQG